jgi:hypothetical protein
MTLALFAVGAYGCIGGMYNAAHVSVFFLVFGKAVLGTRSGRSEGELGRGKGAILKAEINE